MALHVALRTWRCPLCRRTTLAPNSCQLNPMRCLRHCAFFSPVPTLSPTARAFRSSVAADVVALSYLYMWGPFSIPHDFPPHALRILPHPRPRWSSLAERSTYHLSMAFVGGCLKYHGTGKVVVAGQRSTRKKDGKKERRRIITNSSGNRSVLVGRGIYRSVTLLGKNRWCDKLR